MSGANLHVRDLEYRRPEGFQLRVPELRLEAGARLACIGPSGSGKSTLLDLVAGILTPHAGRIEIGDVSLSSLREAERRRFRLEQIGFVFQDFALLEHLSVRDNVLLRWLLGPSTGIQERRLELSRLAAGFGIDALLDRNPRALSQGERQRVAICQALVGSPSLVLADEPTGNLDPETTQRSVELLLSEVSRRGTTLIFVTHDHSLLARFDDVLDLEPKREVRA